MALSACVVEHVSLSALERAADVPSADQTNGGDGSAGGTPAARSTQPPEGGTPNYGGFVGFVPLPYQPENNDIPVHTPPSVALDALRTLAVSRIYLDNFDHITAYWVGLGLKLAQGAAMPSANDLRVTSAWPQATPANPRCPLA